MTDHQKCDWDSRIEMMHGLGAQGETLIQVKSDTLLAMDAEHIRLTEFVRLKRLSILLILLGAFVFGLLNGYCWSEIARLPNAHASQDHQPAATTSR